MINRLDVLAVIRAPLENYPPSLNQIQLLAENGSSILVVDVAPLDDTSYGFWSHPSVRRLRVGRQVGRLSLPRRFAEALRFTCTVRRAIRAERPRVVIAYDPNGMAAAGLPEAFNVWHFHELFDPSCERGLLTRGAIAFAHRHVGRADLVIFPDAGRAEAFAQMTGQENEAQVVFNCPRRVEAPPPDRLRAVLAERGVPNGARIVLFQGWVGPSRCLEPVIRSMAAWPADAHLVLVGPVKDEYRASLLSLAAGCGAADRVVFLDRVPYSELLGYTAGASLGLSIVSEHADNNLSWKYTAGAINKRFEYMAVGLPQIANRGPGMSALIEDTGVGLLVDPRNSGEIGSVVARLMAEPELLKSMSERGRRAHLGGFSYEAQFLPVLDRLDGVLQGAKIR